MNVDKSGGSDRAGEQPPVAPTATSRRVSGPVGRRGSRPAAPPPQDSLTLSAGAEEFKRLRAGLDALTDPAREARVADLRDRIARGAYEVDAGRVAEAMLRDEALVRQLA